MSTPLTPTTTVYELFEAMYVPPSGAYIEQFNLTNSGGEIIGAVVMVRGLDAPEAAAAITKYLRTEAAEPPSDEATAPQRPGRNPTVTH